MDNSTTVKKGIPGSTLKIIAIITMLIDHIGAVILERMPAVSYGLYRLAVNHWGNIPEVIQDHGIIVIVYVILRLIGRLGFPIFCFLLIEGFLYTRNVWKYALRLFLFSLISEIPFNLAFRGDIFDTGYQNVFFTLLTGLLTLILIQLVEKKLASHKIIQYLFIIPITVAFMLAAELLIQCDYGASGILTIVVMYLLRKNRVLEMTGGCVVLTAMNYIEFTSFLTLIPISKYNGERGLKLKYVFYAFYPVHLFILYLIACFMGL